MSTREDCHPLRGVGSAADARQRSSWLGRLAVGVTVIVMAGASIAMFVL